MKSYARGPEFGGAFVEAAVVTPFLITLIVSIMQFGYVYGVLSNLRGASAVGARAAVLGSGQSSQQVCSAARNALASIIDTTELNCYTSPSVLPAAANSPVTITLSYPVPILASSSGLLRGPTFMLTAHTTMQ
jgi:Flp pilus assembly protein TadG